MLLNSACSLNKLDTTITSHLNDGLAGETLIRYSSDRIKKLYDNQDKKISALAKCHNGSIKDGLNDLKNMLNNFRNDFDYWNKVGVCYFLDGESNKSEFYFNHSLSLSQSQGKENPNAYNNLGVIFLRNRYFNNAYEMFEKASKEGPNLLTPHFNMAQLNIEFGHIEKAERSLKNLLTHSQNDVDILASLGTVMLIKKQYQSAEAYFQKIDTRNLKRADISNHYAMVLYKLNKFKAAKTALENQNVTTVKPVVEMRKNLTKLINEALAKEKQTKLTAKNLKVRG